MTPRTPRSVQAIYLKPLKRVPAFGVPACDLQLRSYSVKNLEFQADFALRAAYYLNLPASGPIPLPRIVERWTVPRSNFVHKKSQENFERITMRRLIQIQDGNLETVEMWLSFIRKHAYYGVGMKANVWAFEPLSPASFLKSLHVTLTHNVNRCWQNCRYYAGKYKRIARSSRRSFWQAKNIGNIGEGFTFGEAYNINYMSHQAFWFCT